MPRVSQPPTAADPSSSPRRDKLARGEYRPPHSPLDWPQRDILWLPRVEQRHQGTWRCTVRQSALNLTWQTAWLEVKVLPAPSYLSHLLEDDTTQWLFKWTGSELGVQLLLVTLVLLSLGACLVVYVVIVRMYKQWGKII